MMVEERKKKGGNGEGKEKEGGEKREIMGGKGRKFFLVINKNMNSLNYYFLTSNDLMVT